MFSFGVVLLEIVTGREPLNIHRPRPEWSLVEWVCFTMFHDSNMLMHIVSELDVLCKDQRPFASHNIDKLLEETSPMEIQMSF